MNELLNSIPCWLISNMIMQKIENKNKLFLLNMIYVIAKELSNSTPHSCGNALWGLKGRRISVCYTLGYCLP